MKTSELIKAVRFGRWIPEDYLLSRSIKSDFQHYASVKGHLGTITRAIFDRTGEYLITAGEDSKIKLWDVKQCLLYFSFPECNSFVLDMDISFDNQYLAVGTVYEELIIYSLQNGQKIKIFKSFKDESVTSVMFSSYFELDSRFLIVIANGIIFYQFNPINFDVL
uniref:Uncharacterized protein n=1 Tax=Panagrolaimus sp. JU765 TaxID=591449 RepID=A0AC34PVT1_9BILA